MQLIYTDEELYQIAAIINGQRVTLEGLTGTVVCSGYRIHRHLDNETLETLAYQVNAAAMGADFQVWDFGEIDELLKAAYLQVIDYSDDGIEEIVEIAAGRSQLHQLA